MKKPEQNELIEAFLKELKRCGISIKKSSKGHRALLRSSMQTAQRIIVELSSNETLQSQFVHAVKKTAKGRKNPTTFNWHLEVVAMATGASSGKTRKLASKRAGVLEYLRELGVAVNETAATVEKEGLEKLYSAWCKRKKEAEALADAGNGHNEPPQKAPKREKTRNDKDVILPIWMKTSEREQLFDQKLGAMLTVLVSRVSEDEGAFKLKHVMVADSLGESSDDWVD
jgi:hypothetical protein